MKILKLLNKKYLLIILTFFFLFISKLYSEDKPVDIWNIDQKKLIDQSIDKEIVEENIKENISINSIYKMNSLKEDKFDIQEDETLLSKTIKIAGLYDPEENGLTIDMWSNSDGKEILNLLNDIQKIKLSNDAKEILNISLLTNSYFPQQNITNEEFFKLKSDWLIKNGDLKMMQDYLIKNQNINENIRLIKFLVDEYLSKSELEKSCDVFSKINEIINDDYLAKFNIYCLINNNEREVAQLQFDLKKELGFEDNFFEKKFNYLMGYDDSIDQEISEKTILEHELKVNSSTYLEVDEGLIPRGEPQSVEDGVHDFRDFRRIQNDSSRTSKLDHNFCLSLKPLLPCQQLMAAFSISLNAKESNSRSIPGHHKTYPTHRTMQNDLN